MRVVEEGRARTRGVKFVRRASVLVTSYDDDNKRLKIGVMKILLRNT